MTVFGKHEAPAVLASSRGNPISLTYRQRLNAIAANFERRESVGRAYALRELKSDLDNLWRIAGDEELDLIGAIDG